MKHLTVDGMHKLMLALGKYPLTKAEKLQIVNLRPISKIALHVVRVAARTQSVRSSVFP